MAQINRIDKVAIVGASGHLGKHFVEELLKTGKHTITCLTRPDSKSTPPPGVNTVHVAYDNDDDGGEALVAALKGQHFLIITLSVFTPPDTHGKIVKAAVKAGVPYIMPNVYGFDFQNRKLSEESMYGITGLEYCAEIEGLGGSYVAMVCGFWYEWSLALGEQWFGFDVRNRKVTFFDDGETRINTSTWRQCGRALAALLSLPVKGAEPAIEQWRNKGLPLSSFRISQRDMLDSLHRVLGTEDKDWEIRREPTKQRYQDGVEELKNGVFTGRAKAMYTRVFYPNGDGDYEASMGLVNDVLGLPKEELDDATKRAVEMVESGWNPFAH